MASGITGFMPDRPNYGAMGSQAVIDDAKDIGNVALNNARTADAVMSGMAKVESADRWSDVIRAKGAAEGQQAMASGITSGLQAFGTGAIKGGLFGGGGGSSGLGIDTFGGSNGATDINSYSSGTDYWTSW